MALSKLKGQDFESEDGNAQQAAAKALCASTFACLSLTRTPFIRSTLKSEAIIRTIKISSSQFTRAACIICSLPRLAILKSRNADPNFNNDTIGDASHCAARRPTGRYETLSPSWLELRERNLQKLADSVAMIRERIARSDLSFDVDSIYAEVVGPAYDIGERALYADLLVAGPAVFQSEELKSQVVSGGLSSRVPRPVHSSRCERDPATKDDPAGVGFAPERGPCNKGGARNDEEGAVRTCHHG